PKSGRVLGDGERVQVHDAVEGVDLVLAGHPVPQRAQVVAEVDLAGGLDAAEDAGHGRRGYRTPGAEPREIGCPRGPGWAGLASTRWRSTWRRPSSRVPLSSCSTSSCGSRWTCTRSR